jgi:hypothetical protein
MTTPDLPQIARECATADHILDICGIASTDINRAYLKSLVEVRILAALTAATAEQKRDTERLNWLEKSSCLLDFKTCLPNPHWHCTDCEMISSTGTTVRQAIDAAMSKEETP